MKKLEELEKERLKKEKSRINDLLKSYNRTDISENTKHEIIKRLKTTKKAIKYLPDLVRQEIAMNANLLINGLQQVLTNREFRNLYYGDFEEFIETVASLEETTKGYERISNTAYNSDIQKAILYFGFTKEELEILLKKDINEPSRDIFISFINKKYKTQIPTTKELESKAQNDESTDIVDRTKNTYAYKKMKLHNGDYMHGEYPYYYEFELDIYYKELIKESKSIHKRIRKI